MDILRNATARIQSLFASHRGYGTEDPSAVSKSFPQFSQLPAELRIKIWRLALPPRLIHLHLHEYMGKRDESPTIINETEAGDEEEDDISHAFRGTRGLHPTMAITTCNRSQQPCGCKKYPPKSRYGVLSPSVLSVCHESRAATVYYYSTVLNKIYNANGQAVVPREDFLNPRRTFAGEETTPYNPSETGVFFNPAVDIPVIRFNVKSRQDVEDMHHLIAIAVKEVLGIKKVVLQCYIAMPPYMWWQRDRFEKWRRMGANGNWVPRKIVKLKNLEELVLSVEGKELRKMLPEEWRERTVSIWEKELLGMQDRWPGEWEGTVPKLRFVSTLQDL